MPDFVVHIVLNTILLVHNYLGQQMINPHAINLGIETQAYTIVYLYL